MIFPIPLFPVLSKYIELSFEDVRSVKYHALTAVAKFGAGFRYVLNTKTGMYQLASILLDNKHTRTGRSKSYFVTDDGSGVFFDWETTSTAPDTRGSSGVYFRNLRTKQTVLISPTTEGTSVENSRRYMACGMSGTFCGVH
jgi:hypothetical protein